MKARIEERCIGCTIFESICPDRIKMTKRKAEIIDENSDYLKDAANACPRGVIVLNGTDLKNKKIYIKFLKMMNYILVR